ncbi:MAG: hypothetical protein AAFO07_33970 [Bacteroidota bacterium]
MKALPFFILLLCTVNCFAQGQRPDLEYSIKLENPRYKGPPKVMIGIDGGHNNVHQLDGGFAPFAKLMKLDGYDLKAVNIISKEQLDSLDIMVIVNAIHESNVGNWQRPIANAFPKEEIELLENWVQNGGSLLVIADHMPCAGATHELAKAFGFGYKDGFVLSKKQKWPPETYTKKSGDLFDTEVTKGIESITSFTGSALVVPQDATPIARFPKTHKLLIPEVAWQFDKNTEKLDTEGLFMGALKKHGQGKVAFFTEAAMFTAQIVQKRLKVGFNAPEAPNNIPFILNVMHWLDDNEM